MKTIILSAGQGTRLLPLTADRPKCLLEVAEGVSILGWQLTQLAKAGVDEVVVVTGYGAELVEAEILKYRALLNVRCLFNAGFDQMEAQPELVCYPNPAVDYLNILVNDHYADCGFTVYDCNGRAVLQGGMNGLMSKVDLRQLSPGLYQVRLSSKSNTSFNFIKL